MRSIDAKDPVTYGEWIEVQCKLCHDIAATQLKCSNCGYKMPVLSDATPYCCNCGSKMNRILTLNEYRGEKINE